MRLELPAALECRPSVVDSVLMQGLGDFPAADARLITLDPAEGVARFEDVFDAHTSVVAIGATGTLRLVGGGGLDWEGGAVVPIVDRSEDVVVRLLRFGRACDAADSNAVVLPGAVSSVLPGGRFFVSGGHDSDDGLATSASFVIQSGADLTDSDPPRLFVARTLAAASLVNGSFLVVSGGAGARGGPGFDTFEVMQVSQGRLERAGEDFLTTARTQHAQLVLPDGTLLLVGGRVSEGALPLSSVEMIAIGEDGEIEQTGALPARLNVARYGAQAFALSNGEVLIVGGRDADDEPAPPERFDLQQETFELIEGAPVRLDAAYVAVRDRVWQIGGRDDAGEWTGRIDVLLPNGDAFSIFGVLPVLEEPRALRLRDGRVLVAGRNPSDSEGNVFLVGRSAESATQLAMRRTAERLAELSDGVVVLASAARLAFLRLDNATPLDPPPTTLFLSLAEDRARLALDVSDNYRSTELGLVAERAGAFELPEFDFADFEVRVSATGTFRLSLHSPASTFDLAADSDQLRAGACSINRVDRQEVVLRRVSSRIQISGGSGESECEWNNDNRVQLGFGMEPGTVIRSVALSRL